MSDLERMALDASTSIPATELHGMVCGFAAGRPTQFVLSDFVQLAGTDALSDEHAVSEFVNASLAEFYATDMSFAPLIPDDTAALAARLSGLAEWCAGFLSGFGAAAGGVGAGAGDLHVDVQEILRDFASISSIDEEIEGDDQDEGSFMEIYEYVRVAAVLSMTLMADQADDDVGDDV